MVIILEKMILLDMKMILAEIKDKTIFKKSIQMLNSIKFFRAPDSSFYIFIKDFLVESLKSELTEILPTLKSEQKIRVIFDQNSLINKSKNDSKSINKDELESFLKAFLSKNSISKQVLDYKTNFYQVSKQEANLIQKWNLEYKDDFKYFLVENKNELEVFKNFQINSFASYIENNSTSKTHFQANQNLASSSGLHKNSKKENEIKKYFLDTVNQGNTDLFLVKSLKDEFVGCFSLILIDDEIQLHSVAGLAKDVKTYQGSKLTILVAACLDIFLNSQKYKKYKFLSFSSSKSKIAEKYQKIGFKNNLDRSGLILIFDK